MSQIFSRDAETTVDDDAPLNVNLGLTQQHEEVLKDVIPATITIKEASSSKLYVPVSDNNSLINNVAPSSVVVSNSKLDKLWQHVESIMAQNQRKVQHILEEHGIGDGDEDKDSEEGQIWKLIEGKSPYTINLV